MKASEVVANTKTFVQAIGTVCRQVGSRFSDYVELAIPLVLKHAAHEDEELREQCLQACDSTVLKCGKEVSLHIPSITKVCLEYIAYAILSPSPTLKHYYPARYLESPCSLGIWKKELQF